MNEYSNWKTKESHTNMILQQTGFYISYNPSIEKMIADEIITSITTIPPREGKDETAIVVPSAGKIPYDFFILNGDFRKEYEEIGDDLKECIKFYLKNKEQYGSKFSTDVPIELNI